MKLFARNAARSAKQSWGTYIGAACIIALGVFIYVSMMDTLANLSGQVDVYYENSHLADVFAQVVSIPETEVLSLEELPGIQAAFGRLSEDVRLLAENQTEIVSVHLLAYEDSDSLNRIETSDGHAPAADDIYIGTKMMEAYGWQPGEQVKLLVQGKAVDFTVAGTCYAPEYIYAIPPSGAMVPDGAIYDMAAIDRSRFEELFDRKGQFTELGFALSWGSTYEDVRYALKDRLASFGLTALGPREDQSSYDMVAGEINELISIGTVLPIIFMSVSVFMLYTVLRKIIDRDRSLIGTMKAMGCSDRELIFAYLRQGILIGLVGAAGGSIAAVPFGQFMFGMYVDFFNLPDPVYHSYLHTRVEAFLIALAVSMGAVYLGVRGIVKIAPAEAMRAATPGKIRNFPWFDRLVQQLKVMEKLGVRAITRSPFRTFLIVLAIAFPFGLSCVLMSFEGVAEQMYFDQFDKIRTYDIQVSLDHYTSDSRAKAAGELLTGVSGSEAITSIAIELRHDNLSEFVLLNALHPESQMYRIRDIYGTYYEPPTDGLIINSRIAKNLHVQAGDILEVVNTQLSLQPVTLPVKAVIDESMGSGCYLAMESMKQFFAAGSLSDTILLQVPPGRRETVKAELLQAGRVTGMADTERIVNSYRTMMGSMMGMMNMFSMMAVVTGIILIYNISVISIRERKVEFGTLLIMGTSGREIGRMVWFEQVVYLLLGLVSGVPMAYGFKAMIENLIMSDSYTIRMQIEPMSYLKAFFICIMVVTVSGLSVVRVIRKIQPTDILKERE